MIGVGIPQSGSDEFEPFHTRIDPGKYPSLFLYRRNGNAQIPQEVGRHTLLAGRTAKIPLRFFPDGTLAYVIPQPL